MSSNNPLAQMDAEGLGLIVDDLVTSAKRISSEWALALAAEQSGDYDTSMTHIGHVVGQLIAVPIQAEDIRSAAYEALDALEEITEGRPK